MVPKGFIMAFMSDTDCSKNCLEASYKSLAQCLLTGYETLWAIFIKLYGAIFIKLYGASLFNFMGHLYSTLRDHLC